MKKALTDRTVKALKPADKPYEVRDDELTGYLARVQPTGRISFYVEYRADGKRNRVKLGTLPKLTVPKAREKAKEVLAGIALGSNPAEEKKAARNTVESLTLRQFLDDHYAPWAKVNLKSHAPTMARLKGSFLPLLDKKLADLTSWDFEKHRQHRLKHKLDTMTRSPKPAGINRDQQTMRAALTRAIQWGHLTTNPLIGVKRAKEDRNKNIRALSATEEAAILDAFAAKRAELVAHRTEQVIAGKRGLPKVPRYPSFLEVAFILSLGTGLRRGELLSLLWQDVDFAEATVTVRGEGAKSSQTRVVPMPLSTKLTLAAWAIQTKGKGRVFPTATVDAIAGQWTRILAKAKLEKIRWHDLRHSYGSRLAQKGAPLPTIQALMGHAHVQTTSRYLHSTADDAKRAVALLDKPDNVIELDKKKESEG